MILNVNDKVQFNKSTKKSIKDFFIASMINIEKTYKITALEKFNGVTIVEVQDSDGKIIHCPVDKDFNFFNKKTKYKLFRRANGNI